MAEHVFMTGVEWPKKRNRELSDKPHMNEEFQDTLPSSGVDQYDTKTKPLLSSDSEGEGYWKEANPEHNGATSVELDPMAGTFGLVNLGNTCFMNSALQCLTHTLPLNLYFLQDRHYAELNPENPLGMNGYIAEAYGRLVKMLWPRARQDGSPAIVPREFKNVISRFAPQFAGYHQHDSHELLSFLLDGLHEDLNRIKQKPYIPIDDSSSLPDQVIAKKSWENHKKRNDSIIVDLFQGQFRSTLVCPVCQYVSVTFDPFMYLSLPLPVTIKTLLYIPYIPCDISSPPEHLSISVLSNTFTILDLKDEIASQKAIARSNIVLAMIMGNAFQGTLSDYRLLNSIPNADSCLVAYQIPQFQEETPGYLPSDPDFTHAWILFEKEDDESHIDLMDGQLSHFFTYPRLAVLPSSLDHGEALYDHIAGLLSLSSGSFSISVPASFLKQVQSESLSSAVMVNNEKKGRIHFSVSPSLYFLSTVQIHVTLLKSGDTPVWMGHTLDHLHMKPEPEPAKQVTLFDCLELFSRRERLGAQDPWYCPKCKEHRRATKKMDLWKLPSNILVVHLKRFSYSRSYRDKLDLPVSFPIEGLDLGDVVCSPAGDKMDCIYDLYAISHHFGGLGGGHYTAHVKHPIDGHWYDCDDSIVTRIHDPVAEEDIISSSAYVLFYKKRK